MTATLRESLEQKRAAGVKQIRVTTVIAALDEEKARNGARPKREKRPKVLDVVGTAELAAILGVERARIGKWRKIGILLSNGERISLPPQITMKTTRAKIRGTTNLDYTKLAATPLWWGDDARALAARLAEHKPRDE